MPHPVRGSQRGEVRARYGRATGKPRTSPCRRSGGGPPPPAAERGRSRPTARPRSAPPAGPAEAVPTGQPVRTGSSGASSLLPRRAGGHSGSCYCRGRGSDSGGRTPSGRGRSSGGGRLRLAAAHRDLRRGAGGSAGHDPPGLAARRPPRARRRRARGRRVSHRGGRLLRVDVGRVIRRRRRAPGSSAGGGRR